MTARERVSAAVRGEALDRPPFSVWRHFYDREGAGAEALADATVSWTRRHSLDLIKYNPRAHYHAEPWGTRYEYRGDGHPRLVRYAVTVSSGWRSVRSRSVDEPVFAEMREGLTMVRARLPDIPLVMTIFTPLAICERLAGRERLLEDLRRRPDDVLEALDAIALTFGAFARSCLEAGADGVFLATTLWAQRTLLTDAEYARFGSPFDMRVLDSTTGASLNVLHVCGADARVLELARYPVSAVSWDALAPGNPDLRSFLDQISHRASIGGMSHTALLSEDATLVAAEVVHALQASHGRRWIAAGACTIPPETPAATLDRAREALLAAQVS
jgi:uroporphyrinogen decarboxylase